MTNIVFVHFVIVHVFVYLLYNISKVVVVVDHRYTRSVGR